MTESKKKAPGIQSLEIGVSILEVVSSYGRPITFTEIQEATQITKSNLYKYLNSLITLGLLHRDKFGGSYTLGSKLIQYGMTAVNQENVIDRIAPYLQDISNKCKETVLLSIWTADGPMVVRIINNSSQRINIGTQIGSYLPLPSATGVVFAALLEDYQSFDWKKRELARLNENERKHLLDEVESLHGQYFKYRKESLVPSVSAVAAPIFNFEKKVIGVISMVGFAGIITENKSDEKNQYFIQVCEEISQSFGYPTDTQEQR